MGFVNIEATIILSKVIIDNLPLPEYCVKHNYDFNKIVEGYVRQRKIRSLDNRDEKELALRLMKNQDCKRKHSPECRIKVHGMTTAEFAKIKGVPVGTLRKSLTTGHLYYPEKTYDQLADEFVIRYKFNKSRFLYRGLTLTEVYSSTGVYIPLKDVIKMYTEEYDGNDNRPFQVITDEIVDRVLGISIKKRILEKKKEAFAEVVA